MGVLLVIGFGGLVVTLHHFSLRLWVFGLCCIAFACALRLNLLVL